MLVRADILASDGKQELSRNECKKHSIEGTSAAADDGTVQTLTAVWMIRISGLRERALVVAQSG